MIWIKDRREPLFYRQRHPPMLESSQMLTRQFLSVAEVAGLLKVREAAGSGTQTCGRSVLVVSAGAAFFAITEVEKQLHLAFRRPKQRPTP